MNALKLTTATVATLVLLGATGCSLIESVQGDRIDYKSAAKGPSLEIPPDLTKLTQESRYIVPGTVITASGYQTNLGLVPMPVAAATIGDVRIERSGSQRWLVVDRSADKVWPAVREFWQENGFLMSIDQENLGIMETDYAENRAKLPQDFIRQTIGKVFENLYSTGERDKFRTRLERNAAGGTEIYISHRGMLERVVSKSGSQEKQGDGTVWEPRASDPELEAEFLRRLMVKLGVTQEQSKALVAENTTKQTSRISKVNDLPVVQVSENFDRAWRRVGLALDRTGFTVEDRDRAQGTYFVRYVEPVADKKEQGFFSKLFSGALPVAAPLKYRIAVRGQGDALTLVSVLNEKGDPETSANAQRIVIAVSLKSHW